MRKLMWFSIGFATVCTIGAYAYSEWFWLGALVGLLLTGVFCLLRTRWNWMPVAAVLCMGLTSGFCYFSIFHHFYLAPVTEVDGEKIRITAEAIDFGVSTDYGTKVEARLRISNRSYRAILYLQENQMIKPGDLVSGNFLMRFTHEGLEGNTYHRGNGIFLLGYAQGKSQYQLVNHSPYRYFPATIRNQITKRLEKFFPEDTAFFTKALFLGDRSDLDYETKTAFKVSGISHIIAVSGLHVSILFSVAFFLTVRKRPFTALFGIPMLFVFAAVTGFTPSVTRACVMQSLFVLADAIRREYDPPTSLSFAVLIMLVVNPLVVTSVSLQLSVSCMLGIILFSDKLQCWIRDLAFWKNWKGKCVKVRVRNHIASGAAVTLSAMFFTTPLVAVYFGCVSLIGLVTNLLVLWAVSWIFYGIMFVCLLSLIWQQGAVMLAWILSWLIRYVLLIAKTMASIPLAAVYTKSVFVIAWLVMFYLLLVFFLCRSNMKPYWVICTALITLVISLTCSWILPMIDHCRITVLDVGQGQSVILQSQGKTFLVDCGGDNAEDAADIAAETLLSMGIYRLDGVILTHFDGDHAGGIPYLFKRIQVDTLFIPEYAEDGESRQALLAATKNQAVTVYQDIALQWKETCLTIYAPLSRGDDNESGLCILFSGVGCDILITGDYNISSENKLLLEKNIPPLTALIAGHHGSPYSTGSGILAVTSPQYVFISVGKDNRYGHPSQVVLDRLEQYGCSVLRTDLDGTIVFRR